MNKNQIYGSKYDNLKQFEKTELRIPKQQLIDNNIIELIFQELKTIQPFIERQIDNPYQENWIMLNLDEIDYSFIDKYFNLSKLNPEPKQILRISYNSNFVSTGVFTSIPNVSVQNLGKQLIKILLLNITNQTKDFNLKNLQKLKLIDESSDQENQTKNIQYSVILMEMVMSRLSIRVSSINMQNNDYDEINVNVSLNNFSETIESDQVEEQTIRKIEKDIVFHNCKSTQRILTNELAQLILKTINTLDSNVEFKYQIDIIVSPSAIFVVQLSKLPDQFELAKELVTPFKTEKRILYLDILGVAKGCKQLSAMSNSFYKIIARKLLKTMIFTTEGKQGLICFDNGKLLIPTNNKYFNSLTDLIEVQKTMGTDKFDYYDNSLNLYANMISLITSLSVKDIGKPKDDVNLQFQKNYSQYKQSIIELSKDEDHLFLNLKKSLELVSTSILEDIPALQQQAGLNGMEEIRNIFKESYTFSELNKMTSLMELSLPNNMNDIRKIRFMNLQKDFSKEIDGQFEGDLISDKFRMALDDYILNFGFKSQNDFEITDSNNYVDNDKLLLNDLKNWKDNNFDTMQQYLDRVKYRDEIHVKLHQESVKLNKTKEQMTAQENFVKFGGFRDYHLQLILFIYTIYKRKIIQFGLKLKGLNLITNENDIFKQELEYMIEMEDQFNLNSEQNLDNKKEMIYNESPTIFDSRGRIYQINQLNLINNTIISRFPNYLNGIGVGSKSIESQVKLIHNQLSADDCKGKIIVMNLSRTFMVPLYVQCAGIIIEREGTMQHGAVFAQCHSIPCIVGVNIMSKIKDGDQVQMDCLNGIVQQ